VEQMETLNAMQKRSKGADTPKSGQVRPTFRRRPLPAAAPSPPPRTPHRRPYPLVTTAPPPAPLRRRVRAIGASEARLRHACAGGFR
jgi:hypothetical protein